MGRNRSKCGVGRRFSIPAEGGAPVVRLDAVSRAAAGRLIGVWALATWLGCAAVAAEEATTGFDAVVGAPSRVLVRSAAGYVLEHPEAADAERAALWVLRSAESWRFEADVVQVAELAIARFPDNRALLRRAHRVRCVGLTSARRDEAIDALRAALRTFRQPESWEALDLGQAVASRAQLAGRVDLAEAAYRAVADRFLLSGRIGEVAGFRIERLRKIGQRAARISAPAVDGTPFDLERWAGGVVIVDFWGTNCVPCLESFPALKMLYREWHRRGLEVVGISLDRDPAVVRAFQRHWQLPWPLIVDPDHVASWRGRYAVPTIPALFVLDHRQVIRYVDLVEADLGEAVRRLLRERVSK
ncbi:MAG: TlpA family protein disulfide reductase [Planctomycetota bacterium]|nr:MAG: TlpA family protein disulfide reductase [Planctomycetota bacterium]